MILDVTVSNDLKGDDRVDNITAKASRRIYLLKQLRQAGIDRRRRRRRLQKNSFLRADEVATFLEFLMTYVRLYGVLPF